jgi:magnesium-transporting ATPase (P-type)
MSAAAEAAADTKWHALSSEETLKLLQSSEAGLSTAEAEKRLQEYGRNALTPPPKPTFLKKLWGQINT